MLKVWSLVQNVTKDWTSFQNMTKNVSKICLKFGHFFKMCPRSCQRLSHYVEIFQHGQFYYDPHMNIVFNLKHILILLLYAHLVAFNAFNNSSIVVLVRILA